MDREWKRRKNNNQNGEARKTKAEMFLTASLLVVLVTNDVVQNTNYHEINLVK